MNDKTLRRWLLVGSFASVAFALGAAVSLIRWSEKETSRPDWFESIACQNEGRLASEQLPIETRMARALELEPRALLELERALELASRDRTISRVDRAAILCCLGRYDSVLQELRESNLPGEQLVVGVALLSRGLRDGDPRDFVAAAATLEAGLRKNKTDHVLLTGYGEALRHLNLVDTYRRALYGQLSRESEPLWLDRSRGHLRETDREIAENRLANEVFSSGSSFLSTDRREQWVLRYPYLARKLVEEKLLGSWGRAARAGEGDEAQLNLTAASSIAEILEMISGDSLLRETVQSIAHQEGKQLRVAEGFALFQDGFDLFQDRTSSPREALKALSGSYELLLDAGIPFAFWAGLYAAAVEAFDDRPSAVKAWRELQDRAPGAYLALRGHLAWRLGISAQVDNRPADALRFFQDSLQLLETSSGSRGAGFSHNLIAHSFCDLGIVNECWEHRIRAFGHILPTQDFWQRHSALHTTVHSLVRMQNPGLAFPFLEELEINAARWRNQVAQTELLFLKARALSATGSAAEAMKSVEKGRRILMGMSEGGVSSRLSSDADIAEGLVLATTAPGFARELLKRAYSAQESSGFLYDRIPVLSSLSGVGNQFGDSQLSKNSRLDLLNELLRIRTGLANPMDFAVAGRVLEQVVEDAIRLDSVSRDSEVLALLDLLKPGSANRATRSDRDICSEKTLADCVQSRLRSDETILTFHLLADELVVGIIDARNVTIHRQVVSHQRVTNQISRFLESPDSRLSQDLADLLVWRMIPWANLSSSQRLVVVPDGALTSLPFHALPLASGEKLIIETLEVVYYPSLAMFAEKRRIVPESSSSASKERYRSALLVAAPKVARSFEERFPELEYAEAEIQAIAPQFSHYRKLTGENASVSRVMSLVEDFDVIHFAAHGFGGGEDHKGGLILSPDESSLLGILELQHLSRLNLKGVDLIVFSGCSTGLGPDEGEAVLWSLPVTSLEMGVGAALATTTMVDDRDAFLFGLEFYRQLRDAGSAGAAFAEASREFLKSEEQEWTTAHPVWAYYRVIGG